MKKTITIIIALSVFGIAAFGFLSMAHESGHNQGNCLGFVTGADCPAVLVSRSDIAGHIAAVRSFSLGIVTSSLLIGMLFVVALWFAWRHRTFDTQPPLALAYQSQRNIRSDLSSFIRFNKWLARHEARDPYASLRVHESFGHF